MSAEAVDSGQNYKTIVAARKQEELKVVAGFLKRQAGYSYDRDLLDKGLSRAFYEAHGSQQMAGQEMNAPEYMIDAVKAISDSFDGNPRLATDMLQYVAMTREGYVRDLADATLKRKSSVVVEQQQGEGAKIPMGGPQME